MKFTGKSTLTTTLSILLLSTATTIAKRSLRSPLFSTTRLFSMSKKARLFNHNEARVALCQIHVTTDKTKN